MRRHRQPTVTRKPKCNPLVALIVQHSLTLRYVKAGKCRERERERESDSYRRGQKEVSILPPISRGKFAGRVGRTSVRPSFFTRGRKKARGGQGEGQGQGRGGGCETTAVPRALLSRAERAVTRRGRTRTSVGYEGKTNGRRARGGERKEREGGGKVSPRRGGRKSGRERRRRETAGSFFPS
jgi:hypothetical protein